MQCAGKENISLINCPPSSDLLQGCTDQAGESTTSRNVTLAVSHCTASYKFEIFRELYSPIFNLFINNMGIIELLI